MHDAALDRRHRRQQLLAAVAAHAVRHFARGLLELLDAPALERAAIELDVLLHLAAHERLVRQHLNRVEQLAVMFGEAARVAAIEAHDDLRVVLFGAHHERQARQLNHALAPLAHELRGLGLGALLRNLDLFDVLFEVARLQFALIVVVALAARTASAALAATTSAAPAPLPRSSATLCPPRGERRTRNGRHRRRNRRLIDLRFDHDALDAAEEAALLEEDVIGELVAFDAQCLRRVGQGVVETLTLESLGHCCPRPGALSTTYS